MSYFSDYYSMFMREYGLFALMMLSLNFLIAYVLTGRLFSKNSYVYKVALERGNEGKSIKQKLIKIISEIAGKNEERGDNRGLYGKIRIRLKKAGYVGVLAPAYYLIIVVAVPIIVFFITLFVNYPDIGGGAVFAVIIALGSEMIIRKKQKAAKNVYFKNAYKVYKFIQNQVSSGVKVTDALKSTYEVIDDIVLKQIFTRMVGVYELTHDIDQAMDEFRELYNIPEAHTFCIAVKQSVQTGESGNLMASQEDIMFRRFFNYIRVETDACRTKSILAVLMLVLVIIIMIAVPLLNDVSSAAGKVFMN